MSLAEPYTLQQSPTMSPAEPCTLRTVNSQCGSLPDLSPRLLVGTRIEKHARHPRIVVDRRIDQRCVSILVEGKLFFDFTLSQLADPRQ